MEPFLLPRLRLGSGAIIPNPWGGVGIYPYPSSDQPPFNQTDPLGSIGPPHHYLFYLFYEFPYLPTSELIL
jgi:hypothetical protein